MAKISLGILKELPSEHTVPTSSIKYVTQSNVKRDLPLVRWQRIVQCWYDPTYA